MQICENEVESNHGRPFGTPIVINGRPRYVDEKKLGYLEIIDLAFPGQVPTDLICFTVTFSYRNGKGGSLVEGGKTRIRKGIVFNVARTDKS